MYTNILLGTVSSMFISALPSFTLLCFADTVFFLIIEGLWHPCVQLTVSIFLAIKYF